MDECHATIIWRDRVLERVWACAAGPKLVDETANVVVDVFVAMGRAHCNVCSHLASGDRGKCTFTHVKAL